jgi:hypothetical protein
MLHVVLDISLQGYSRSFLGVKVRPRLPLSNMVYDFYQAKCVKLLPQLVQRELQSRLGRLSEEFYSRLRCVFPNGAISSLVIANRK